MDIVNNSSIEIVGKGLTVLRMAGGKIYAGRGYNIYVSEDNGKTWDLDGRAVAGLIRRAAGKIDFLRRITRGGVATVLPLSDGARLCVISGALLRAETGSKVYRPVFRFAKGSRPLNLCLAPDGSIYWGEYFLNLRRSEPVNIYSSEDGGKTWKVAYTFTRGSICHVHRVIYDRDEDAFLICTGDRDHEVAILKTTDRFKTLIPLVRGEQRFRTTSLVPFERCILYGTDNPGGDNFIMSLERGTAKVRKVQKVPGPVLYGCRVGDKAVFSTMVEKKEHEVTVWAGNPDSFSLVAEFGTNKGCQVSRELVGYSAAILPEGQSDDSFVFCTPVGTLRFNNEILRIRVGGQIERH